MAKRFFYVCAGILALVLTYHFGATSAGGQGLVRVIGPNTVVVGSNAFYLEISNPPFGWRQLPYNGNTLPPVPVTSLASYQLGTAITDTGEGWYATAGVWVSAGTPPSVATIPSTWGSVKAKYR